MKPLRHLSARNGALRVTIDDDGLTIKAPGKHKGIHLSYEEAIAYALSLHPNLRWPPEIEHQPLEQLKHLGRRL